ncbi:MAG: TfoX/Sxy family protein [Zoogloeaceae bacterium]|jgi:DNA transformation protein|nr:TfoX/Sxy family protein [Zoogloeaceae bacterium]
MVAITALKLGKTMASKLNSVGIRTAGELIETGSKEAVRRLKVQYPSTCVVILYHLQAAIEGVEMKMLSPETKADLKQFFHQLRSDAR